jgi:hypothetical protein
MSNPKLFPLLQKQSPLLPHLNTKLNLLIPPPQPQPFYNITTTADKTPHTATALPATYPLTPAPVALESVALAVPLADWPAPVLDATAVWLAPAAPVWLAELAAVSLTCALAPVPLAVVVVFCTLKKFPATSFFNPLSSTNFSKSNPILSVTFFGGLILAKSAGISKFSGWSNSSST